jgi:hypothetical protein
MAVNETPRVEPQPAVLVDRRQGEYLVYKVTVSGATPVFTLADDRGRTILTSEGASPRRDYEREWPLSPDDDPIPRRSEHEIIGLMALVTKYTLTVELCHRDGSVKETVIDSDYERVAPLSDTDKFRRGLSVRLML